MGTHHNPHWEPRREYESHWPKIHSYYTVKAEAGAGLGQPQHRSGAGGPLWPPGRLPGQYHPKGCVSSYYQSASTTEVACQPCIREWHSWSRRLGCQRRTQGFIFKSNYPRTSGHHWGFCGYLAGEHAQLHAIPQFLELLQSLKVQLVRMKIEVKRLVEELVHEEKELQALLHQAIEGKDQEIKPLKLSSNGEIALGFPCIIWTVLAQPLKMLNVLADWEKTELMQTL